MTRHELSTDAAGGSARRLPRWLAGVLAAGLLAGALLHADGARAQVIDEPPPLGALCTMLGTPGPDTLTGTPGDDVICGQGGDDVIDGLGGNDLLAGGAGDDSLQGGAGNDRLQGGDGTDVLTGAGGADIQSGGAGQDGVSYRQLPGPVTVDLAPADSVEAGVTYAHGNGAAGENDRIGHDVERIVGSDGNDSLNGSGRGETFDAGAGVDRVDGRGGGDVLAGSTGDDVLGGGPGNDIIVGQAGADQMTGDDGVDTFNADAGADGDDVMTGGAGIDRVSYLPRGAAVRVDLSQPGADQGSYDPASGMATERDRISAIERANGGSGGDLLLGSAGEDGLFGEGGADRIDPRGGVDSVDAGTGDDVVESRDAAADLIDCGPGTDGHRSDSADAVVNCENVVLPETDLSVSLSDAPDPVSAGELLTYTATVRNLGTETEPAAIVTIDLPAGLTGITAVSGGCTVQVSGDVRCTLPSLVGGAMAAVGVRGRPVEDGRLSATAAIASRTGTTDPVAGNDQATADTTVLERSTDLAITIDDAPDPVAVNGQLELIVTVTNLGELSEAGPRVSITPSRVIGLAGPTSGPVTCQGTAALLVRCFLPRIGADESVTFRMTASPAQAGTLTTTASISDRIDTTDPASANDTDTETTTVEPTGPAEADLSVVSVTAEPNPTTYAGTTQQTTLDVLITVVVRNAGPRDVRAGVGVTVPTFNAGTGFAVYNEGSLNPADDVVCGFATSGGSDGGCALDLDAGQTRTLRIGAFYHRSVGQRRARSQLLATTSWRIGAVGESTPVDPDGSNDARSLTVVASPPSDADLAITNVTATSFPAATYETTRAGSTETYVVRPTTYTVTVANRGSSATTAQVQLPTAVVTGGGGSGLSSGRVDVHPDGTLSQTCPPASCASNLRTVLAAGQSRTISVLATIRQTVTTTTTPGGLPVKAATTWTVRPAPGLPPDTVPANDSRMHNHTAKEERADLTVSSVTSVPAKANYQIVPAPTGFQGQRVLATYTITVKNKGPLNTTARLALPTLLFELGSSQPPDGSIVLHSGATHTSPGCTAASCASRLRFVGLASGESRTVTFPATIDRRATAPQHDKPFNIYTLWSVAGEVGGPVDRKPLNDGRTHKLRACRTSCP